MENVKEKRWRLSLFNIHQPEVPEREHRENGGEEILKDSIWLRKKHFKQRKQVCKVALTWITWELLKHTHQHLCFSSRWRNGDQIYPLTRNHHHCCNKTRQNTRNNGFQNTGHQAMKDSNRRIAIPERKENKRGLSFEDTRGLCSGPFPTSQTSNVMGWRAECPGRVWLSSGE